MLVANPHLLWSDFYLFFEAQLTAPGFNAYGVSLIGMPVLSIAFNEYLGWTHTVNTIYCLPFTGVGKERGLLKLYQLKLEK